MTVNDGESVSFSCVLPNSSVNQWFINHFPVSAELAQENYVLWSGCNNGKVFCGGTLFIKHVNKSLSGSQVYCQVVCENNSVVKSKPATITGEL